MKAVLIPRKGKQSQMNKKETGHEKMKKKKESFLNIVLYCEQLLHLCNL